MKNVSKYSSQRGQKGQGMTEYIIIVALIAIAAIGVTQLFGETVQNQMGAMAAELGGGAQGGAANTAAQTAGDAAATESMAGQHTLGDYATENDIGG